MGTWYRSDVHMAKGRKCKKQPFIIKGLLLLKPQWLLFISNNRSINISSANQYGEILPVGRQGEMSCPNRRKETDVLSFGQKAKIFLTVFIGFSPCILEKFPKLPKTHTAHTNIIGTIGAKTSQYEELNVTDGYNCIDLIYQFWSKWKRESNTFQSNSEVLVNNWNVRFWQKKRC